jgi:hypothetical protein
MIIGVWVFFLLGDSLVDNEGPAYTQITASNVVHNYAPEKVEEACAAEFHRRYPHHVIADGGWVKQKVQVNEV